jgi:hypothetical protein
LHPSVEQVAGAINVMIAERAAERLGNASVTEPTPEPSPKPREPGVYFGLPSAEYHADPSLGSADLKRLLQAPAVYWWHSWMNAKRQATLDTPAKQKGRALHKLVLEGEEAFAKAFAEEPQPDAGCLVTLEDFKARCRELREPVSGTKAELAKRIKVKDPKAIIFDDILATFRVMAERDGLEVLKADAMREVRQSAATITVNPHLARAFTGGAPEVSVFWVEHDVPLKARFDYLKPKTIVDLKRLANQRERPVDLAILLAIAEYRYDVQARHYLSAYWHLWMAAQEDAVFGDCPLPKNWPDQIALPDDIAFTWVFHCVDAPVSKGRSITPDAPALNRATREITQAKQLYRERLAKFGTAPWVSDEPVRAIGETDVPAWMREDVEVL